MSRHEGVSCDVCMASGFGGRRLKCLVCYDFDLCGPCYDAGQSGGSHSRSHPVQCILTANDMELYHEGEALESGTPVGSLTCPLCAQMGFAAAELGPHLADSHPGVQTEPVICPICASLPSLDPNRMTTELGAHLATWHESLHSQSNPSSASSRGGRRSGGSRGPQRQTAIRGRTAAARLQRDEAEADPIAELLGQLGGIRRPTNAANYASTLSQIQQLQQQLGRGTRRSGGEGRSSGRALAALDEAGAPPPPPPAALAELAEAAPPPPPPSSAPPPLAAPTNSAAALKLPRKNATALGSLAASAQASASRHSEDFQLPKLLAERRRAAEAVAEASGEWGARREFIADLLVGSIDTPVESLLYALPPHLQPKGRKEEVKAKAGMAPLMQKGVAVVAPTPASSSSSTGSGRPTAMVAPHPNPTRTPASSLPAQAPTPAPPAPTLNVTTNPTAAEEGGVAQGVVVGLPAGSSGENYALVSATSSSATARLSRNSSAAASASSNGGASTTPTEASLIRAHSSASAGSGPTPV